MPPRDALLAAPPAMTPEEAHIRRTEAAGVSVAATSAALRSPRQGPKTGQPGPFTREIKIWDPSMLPLGATTHNQDTYKAYTLSPAPSSAAQAAYMPSPHKCEGTTTSAQDYQAWPLERPAPPPAARAQGAGSSHKFEGTTHNQDTYRAWKIEPVPAAQQAAYMPSPHKCEGTSTSAQAYQAWPLERGAAAAAAPRAAASGSTGRFEGESEARAAYTAKPLPQSPRTPASAGLVRSLPFEGQSETSRAYQQPVLLQPTSSSLPALGVVTEGGRFHSLIAAGWTPPTRGSATFTTVTVHPPLARP
jgi:hypothetical protein